MIKRAIVEMAFSEYSEISILLSLTSMHRGSLHDSAVDDDIIIDPFKLRDLIILILLFI